MAISLQNIVNGQDLYRNGWDNGGNISNDEIQDIDWEIEQLSEKLDDILALLEKDLRDFIAEFE